MWLWASVRISGMWCTSTTLNQRKSGIIKGQSKGQGSRVGITNIKYTKSTAGLGSISITFNLHYFGVYFTNTRVLHCVCFATELLKLRSYSLCVLCNTGIIRSYSSVPLPLFNTHPSYWRPLHIEYFYVKCNILNPKNNHVRNKHVETDTLTFIFSSDKNKQERESEITPFSFTKNFCATRTQYTTHMLT